MFVKGNTHSSGRVLARYLATGVNGERAQVIEVRGFGITDIHHALRSVDLVAAGTRCEKPLFHVQVRNRDGEQLTQEQWLHAADRIEKKLGLEGQPRAVALHTLKGDWHMHVAWSRLDENLNAKSLPFFKLRLKEVAHALALEFNLEPTRSERRPDEPRAPRRAEEEQARRAGIDPGQVRQIIRGAWDRSDSGRAFAQALEQSKLRLARGDRRDYVVVYQGRDGPGEIALGKRLLGVSAAVIRDRLADLAETTVPGVLEARAALAADVERTAEQRREEAHRALRAEEASRELEAAPRQPKPLQLPPPFRTPSEPYREAAAALSAPVPRRPAMPPPIPLEARRQQRSPIFDRDRRTGTEQQWINANETPAILSGADELARLEAEIESAVRRVTRPPSIPLVAQDLQPPPIFDRDAQMAATEQKWIDAAMKEAPEMVRKQDEQERLDRYAAIESAAAKKAALVAGQLAAQAASRRSAQVRASVLSAAPSLVVNKVVPLAARGLGAALGGLTGLVTGFGRHQEQGPAPRAAPLPAVPRPITTPEQAARHALNTLNIARPDAQTRQQASMHSAAVGQELRDRLRRLAEEEQRKGLGRHRDDGRER